ncbi:multidrug ABC transporter ATP-binding protein [Amycolatopsis coloradensis]|uniref:Multidrug ABC transporter ATP-binding protein n=1 Tax=Amycolatopsis coloradensis TaxID=76021 RepID=A0A1R0KH93_9PSEU|nr:ABC transporter ATP-binding protein [Amycolatopsis coloradensis]OLZ45012.1 multidrug ABC transporter ATP-binding protein [Amycolatopsis coloradensis]
MTPAVRLRAVVKTYGERAVVRGLDLEVRAGTCLGLLGPNGAGKSTLLRMLTGQTTADSGEIEVLGHPVPERARQVKARLGVVPQHDDLDGELSARQNLEFFARLGGVPRKRLTGVVDHALALTRLRDRAGDRVEKLSGGMRRRLQLARAVLGDPELLLLDEPTVGLDPQVRQELWELVDDLRSRGTSVVMTTHYIEEAARLADDVVVLRRGEIVATGTPAELLVEHAGAQAVEYLGDARRRAEVVEIAGRAGLPHRQTGMAVSVLRAEEVPPGVADELGPADVRRPTSLEDVFVVLTGESLT